MSGGERPDREVRALYTEDAVRVYQAYPPAIADAALGAGTFVAPFKRERMTWVKPSFLWIAYRCGYARKAGQERVLAVDITREGFHWALERSALSHFVQAVHADRDAWAREVKALPVRVQWDPERDLRHHPLPHRSLQVGLSGEAVRRYADEWITGITDVTDLMREVHGLVSAGREQEALALLPQERPYALPEGIAARVGAS